MKTFDKVFVVVTYYFKADDKQICIERNLEGNQMLFDSEEEANAKINELSERYPIEEYHVMTLSDAINDLVQKEYWKGVDSCQSN